MKRKKITLNSHPRKVIKKTENEKMMEKDLKQLIYAYIFLLASCLLLTGVLDNFKINIIDMNATYKTLALPVIFFIANIITKKFGFKVATKAIVISTLTSFIFSGILNLILLNKVNLFVTFKDVIGYMVAMFINLSIYYYLLINTKMSFIPVTLTYLFSLLINNLTSMLFKYNMIYSDYFWQEYFLLIIVQLTIVLPLAVIDKEIERGI